MEEAQHTANPASLPETGPHSPGLDPHTASYIPAQSPGRQTTPHTLQHDQTATTMDIDGLTQAPNTGAPGPQDTYMEAVTTYPDCPLAERIAEWLEDEGLGQDSGQMAEVITDLFHSQRHVWDEFTDDASRPPSGRVRDAVLALFSARLTGADIPPGFESPSEPTENQGEPDSQNQHRPRQQTRRAATAVTAKPQKVARTGNSLSGRGRGRDTGQPDTECIARNRPRRNLGRGPWYELGNTRVASHQPPGGSPRRRSR